MTVIPSGAIEIVPGDEVRQGLNEQKVYLFDWDRRTLADAVTINASTFTITALKPSDDTALTKDSETVLSGDRKTWLRLMGGTLGARYQITNAIETNEDPAQKFEKSFFLLIQHG